MYPSDAWRKNYSCDTSLQKKQRNPNLWKMFWENYSVQFFPPDFNDQVHFFKNIIFFKTSCYMDTDHDLWKGHFGLSLWGVFGFLFLLLFFSSCPVYETLSFKQNFLNVPDGCCCVSPLTAPNCTVRHWKHKHTVLSWSLKVAAHIIMSISIVSCFFFL